MRRFKNRKEAGALLADRLVPFQKEDPLILAIPHGGVPVAYEVAKKLGADMDLLIVKKISAPENPDLAIGAVGEDGRPWYNNKIIGRLGIKTAALKSLGETKATEVRDLVYKLRGARPAIPIEGRVLILIDDGITTGATLMAAVNLLRVRKPKRIIIATPVASAAAEDELRAVAEEVVSIETLQLFTAVKDGYHQFPQVAEDEILRTLQNWDPEQAELASHEVLIRDGSILLKGDLQLVPEMRGVVVFAHGSGSSRSSRRNQYVARELNKVGFWTFLTDLLTEEEAGERKNVFDAELLIQRLVRATDTVVHHLPDQQTPIAYFGSNTGAAAALGAAAKGPREIFAIVCRGGRTDLADTYLSRVKVPTLLLVGAADPTVISINETATKLLSSSKLVKIPRATHLFEEEGALDEVVEYATDWLLQFVPSQKPLLPPLESVLREIQDLAYPIQREGGWYELITTIAKAQVVMLGEATHGSAEFYSIRRLISEKLIRDHGFDFIAVEGDWPDCQKLNSYIRSGKGKSAKDVMRHFHRWPTWMWANDETAALIEWMQSYQAEFYGLDIYSLFDSMDYVRSYAERIDPELGRVVSGRYACFEPFHRNEKAYAQHLTKFNEGCRAEVVQNLRQLLRLRMEDIGLKNGDLFNAQQNARIVKNAEEYYRAMIFGGSESWNIRDQHMLETLDHLLHQGPRPRKGIVWAHNSHIGDYNFTDMLEEGYVNLGGLAREKFGADKVALVGFGTFQGEVLASPSWEGPETITPLPPAREGSFEDYCHKALQIMGTKRFYLIFDPAARKTVLGTRQYGHRAVGVVYHPRFETHGRNYVPTTIGQRYDAFVFVDKTSALRSIPTLRTTKELPETWPGGF